MKAVGIIPVRLAATRLPNKPLADIAGKPMVQHVWERAWQAASLADVFIATPDDAIMDAVTAFGGRAVQTSHDCRTGADRVAEAAESLPGDVEIIVNVQGDEPLLVPESLDALVAAIAGDETVVMASLMCPLPESRAHEPSVVKVVCDRNGDALYFSRSPLPFRRNPDAPIAYRQHLGLYAYRRAFLQTLAALEATTLERAESLEQLRVLENGYKIRMVATDRPIVAVDTAEDLERVRALFAQMP